VEYVTAQKGDRLDEIVFTHYGTLEVFEIVLEENRPISTKLYLEYGDIVWLPQIIIEQEIEAKSLWE